MALKWRDLTRPCKIPNFNLHHLRKISARFKMAVLTPKSGILTAGRKCAFKREVSDLLFVFGVITEE